MEEKERECVCVFCMCFCVCCQKIQCQIQHKNESDCLSGARIAFRLRMRQKTFFYHKNCVLCCSVVSDSLGLHGLQPTRLLCPWGFSSQEYWSGLPCPPPGELPCPGIEPRSPAFQEDSLLSEPPRKPIYIYTFLKIVLKVVSFQKSFKGIFYLKMCIM